MGDYVRYCPKCGSKNHNAETVGNGEPRTWWCMDCEHTQFKAFKETPPKKLDFESVEKRISSIKHRKRST